ncbi:hypothetical protein [Catellatospora methionotrophica]|uniref:hypothetical protein n=1 Tax=Catellatospora methionotrophica TaxID=121620 RepID=UPI0034091B31
MTDQPITGLAWVPEACSLPTAERPLRLTEFDALFNQAAHSSERSAQHLRLSLAGDPDLEATVRDLTARESDCCSFFTFTVAAAQPGRVQLDIEVPAAHVDVLDALAERVNTAQGGQ